MLNIQKVEAALGRLRDDLSSYQAESGHDRRAVRQALEQFKAESFEVVMNRLGDAWDGAAPTAEWRQYPDFRVPFESAWVNHEQAREWAHRHILGQTTFAVDGSQIKAARDYSLPVAMVQIGWFENQHTPQGRYEKDSRLEVIPPHQLYVRGEVSDQAVDLIRTRLELGRIAEYIEQRAGSEPAPIIFYDGPLLLSFAERLRETKSEYIRELMRVLNLAGAARLPIIGYIDSSQAHDLVEMLARFYQLDLSGSGLSDGALLRESLRMGERTPVMLSRRPGIQQEYAEPWRTELAFVYLKMSEQAMPARIEFPLWMYREGLLERALDIIRAEVIIGNGYPYCIETADVTALLTQQDRDYFYRIFQAFMEKHGWDWQLRSKTRSKQRRR
jgi:NurA domain